MMDQFLKNHKKELIFASVFIAFMGLMYLLYFPHSIIESLENIKCDTPSSKDPMIQVGENSASINTLRESLNKINPDAILNRLDKMEGTIQTNADMIAQINSAMSGGEDGDANDDEGEDGGDDGDEGDDNDQ